MRNPGLFLPLLFVLAGCGFTPSEEPNHEQYKLLESFEELSVNSFELVRDVEYHDSLFIEHLSAIAVDRRLNLYMAGERHNSAKIYRFSPEGVLLDSLGGYGSEPGEFMSIENIEIREEYLLVFDDRLSRVTAFMIGGYEVAETIQFSISSEMHPDFNNPEQYRIRPVAVLGESGYLVEVKDIRSPAYYNDRKSYYFRAAKNGDLDREPLFSLRAPVYLIGDHAGRPAPFLLPYPERSLVITSARGNLFNAWTEEFAIEKRDSDGRVIDSYLIPYERVEMDSQRMVDYDYGHNRQLQLTRGSADYPEQWPALYSMFADAHERVWVSSIPDDEDYFEWWVFQSGTDGADAEARFRWPRVRQPAASHGNYLYTIERDETGFGMAVRYRMERPAEESLSSDF
jgi:hypothetical protein